jgi:GNAT superfamily N-acetyltransferase
MHVRPALPSDLELLTEWSRDFEVPSEELYGGPREPFIGETLRMLSAHPERGGVYILETERGPIGYTVLVRFWSNEARGDSIVIDELYIAPAHRGGIGLAALRAIEELSRSLGCFLIALEVAPTHRAASLYQRAGYETGNIVYYKLLGAS